MALTSPPLTVIVLLSPVAEIALPVMALTVPPVTVTVLFSPMAEIALPIPEEITPTPIPLSESDEWYELFMSDRYWQLHQTAYRFIRAYYYADMDAAKRLAADAALDRWLSWFPTEWKSLDNLSGYFVYVNRGRGTIKYYEKNGEQFRIIPLHMHISDVKDERTYLIHLDLIYINGNWKITDFAGDS